MLIVLVIYYQNGDLGFNVKMILIAIYPEYPSALTGKSTVVLSAAIGW